jgi:hypothetical protein
MWEKRNSCSEHCAPATSPLGEQLQVSTRRLDVPQSQSGCFGEQIDRLSLPGIKPHILVSTLTELSPHHQLVFSWFPQCLWAKCRAVCYHCSLFLSHHHSQSQFVTIYKPHNLSPSTSHSIKKNTQSFVKHLRAIKVFSVIIVIIFQWFWCVITQHINCWCCTWPRMEVLCSSQVS